MLRVVADERAVSVEVDGMEAEATVGVEMEDGMVAAVVWAKEAGPPQDRHTNSSTSN